MTFKECVKQDLINVFHNTEELAEKADIYYDGEKYSNVSVVINMLSDDRSKKNNDYEPILFKISAKAYIMSDDLGGVMPRKNHNIQIGDIEYRIVTAKEELGDIVLELEAIDE